MIFAPNHRNALMDALAIALITPANITTSFLARADIFKNKKAAAFLRFAKIMPAFRIRDGYQNLSRNNEVFDECVDLLEQNQALCIMPEGNQEIKHKIRQLVKGIFRIAFAVQQKNTSNRPLQIIPVGLDYGDIIKFRKHLIINIGKPIDVSDYTEAYSQNQALAINEIRKELTARLKSLALHIESDAYYDTILQASEFSYSKILKNRSMRINKLNKLHTQIQLADQLSELEKVSPEKMADLAIKCTELTEKMQADGIQSRNLYNRKDGKALIIRVLGLFVTSPIFVLGFILNILPFGMPVFIRKQLKVEFEGFFSSIQFVLGLITFPLFYFIQSILVCSTLSVNMLVIPLIIGLHILTGVLAFKWYVSLKKTIAESRYYFLSQNEKKLLKDLRKVILKKVGINV
jgi:1-acyl-sn-glycerol-3-phosphate acyltransferase